MHQLGRERSAKQSLPLYNINNRYTYISIDIHLIFIIKIKHDSGLYLKLIGKMWKTECLNTRFPLSTPLHAGYDMKLKKFKKYLQNSFSHKETS